MTEAIIWKLQSKWRVRYFFHLKKKSNVRILWTIRAILQISEEIWNRKRCSQKVSFTNENHILELNKNDTHLTLIVSNRLKNKYNGDNSQSMALVQRVQQHKLPHILRMQNYIQPMLGWQLSLHLNRQKIFNITRCYSIRNENTFCLPPVAPNTAPAAEKHATTTAAQPWTRKQDQIILFKRRNLYFISNYSDFALIYFVLFTGIANTSTYRASVCLAQQCNE